MQYPLVNKQFAIENGHRNSGCYPLKMMIFHSYMLVYQRVHLNISSFSSPHRALWCWAAAGDEFFELRRHPFLVDGRLGGHGPILPGGRRTATGYDGCVMRYKGYRFGYKKDQMIVNLGIIWVLYGYYMGIQYSGSIWSWWKFNQTILDWTFENLARISSKLMDVELHPGWSCRNPRIVCTVDFWEVKNWVIGRHGLNRSSCCALIAARGPPKTIL